MKLPLTIESRTSKLQSGGQVFEAELMDGDLRIMARVYGYEAEAAITHLPIGKDEVDTTARQIQRAVNSHASLVVALEALLEFSDNGTPIHPGSFPIEYARAALSAAY